MIYFTFSKFIDHSSPLNFFSPLNRYLFNLIATQTFSNRPPTSSRAIVQLNLENYNVNAPIFVPTRQTFSISETAVIGSRFGTVYATDADNDGIIYSIESSQFSIDSSTGVLQLQQTFRASPASQYFVTVTASDDGSACLPNRPLCPRFSTRAVITINVTAVNKRSPQFLNQICGSNVSFYESNVIDSNVTTLVVFDDDRGENGQITISFPSEQSRTTGNRIVIDIVADRSITILLCLVSGLRNTAYSQFYIQQLSQSNATRTALLRTNVSFDYDAPGKSAVDVTYRCMKKRVLDSERNENKKKTNEFTRHEQKSILCACFLGAPRVWFLFVLATDNGIPQRQCKTFVV
jgi:hypothetical protein